MVHKECQYISGALYTAFQHSSELEDLSQTAISGYQSFRTVWDIKLCTQLTDNTGVTLLFLRSALVLLSPHDRTLRDQTNSSTSLSKDGVVKEGWPS